MLGPGSVHTWNSLLMEGHVLGPGCVHTWNSLLTEGHVLGPGCVDTWNSLLTEGHVLGQVVYIHATVYYRMSYAWARLCICM